MQKQWKLLENPPELFYAEFPELPPLVAKLLYHRNIRDKKKINEFLYSDYDEHVYDPFLFRDMHKAVDRLFTAIKKNEKITIHGDYDADGVSASTILYTTLKQLGATELDVFLPHRELDGYGLNLKTIDLLKTQGTSVIITCDCGVSNTEEITKAQNLGIDVIITDHHALPKVLPPAFATIHPKIEGETYPDQGLAGGGVAFKLAQALLKTQKSLGKTLPNNLSHEAAEKWLLDMTAIASVADMVPLLGESRTLTKFGLIVMNKTRRIGLQKLLLEARLMETDGTLKKEITADTIGFQIAPRINAAGRLDHANVAFKLLTTENPIEATDLAYQLNENNKERQQKTDIFVKEALVQVEKNQKNNPILFVFGSEWTTGIVGLIASRLKEKFQKPCIALAPNGELLTGSGRSVKGFNMIESLQEIPEYFLKFGGHPMACGFSLRDKAERATFENALTQKYSEKTKNIDMTPELLIDAEVTLQEIKWELYDLLDKFKPFGVGNEKPKYLVKNVSVTGIEQMGEMKQHLKLLIRQNGGNIKKTVGWRMCEQNGDNINWAKKLSIGDTIDMIFELDINEWNGNRELQMTIVDIRKNT